MRSLFALTVLILISPVGEANNKPSGLVSPFPSTVLGISIPNTHVLAKGDGVVLRGMAPRSKADIQALADYGINEILIFRNDVPGEGGIDDELGWIGLVPKIRAVHLIPFKWKEVDDFRGACQDTIKALQLIQSTLNTRRSGLFFHCTVGEDRTGYLAGLYRLVFEKKNPDKVFAADMCAHGYAEGDPNKPGHVVQTVHDNITVLYLKMLSLIANGKLRSNRLDLSVCDSDPGASPDFKQSLAKKLDSHKCK